MGTVTWKIGRSPFDGKKISPLGPIKITYTHHAWNERGGDLLYRGANDMESNDQRC